MSKNIIGFITIILLLSLTSVFSLKLFFQQRTAQDKLDIRSFPYLVGEWRGKDLKVSEQEYEILETRNLIVRQYEHPSGERLSLFIIYSETNRSVFHPPEVCLAGSGTRITDKRPEEISYGRDKFLVNRLHLEKNSHKELALYCYKAGDLYTDSYYLQQASFAVKQLLGRRVGGATILASMPVRESKEKTLNSLKSFVAQARQIIDNL